MRKYKNYFKKFKKKNWKIRKFFLEIKILNKKNVNKLNEVKAKLILEFVVFFLILKLTFFLIKRNESLKIQLVNLKTAYFQHNLYLFDILFSFVRFIAFQRVASNCYCNYEKLKKFKLFKSIKFI